MSENTQKDMEQTTQETPAAETIQQEKKEKKGFAKKDPKKEKIAELENKVKELENQVAKVTNNLPPEIFCHSVSLDCNCGRCS